MFALTRRQWLASSSLLLAAGCSRPKGTGYNGYALIATAGDNSVAAVDLTAFRLVKTIALGAPPTAIIPGTRNQTFVLTPSTGSVHIIDGNLNLIVTRRLADRVSEIHLVPDGSQLLAISAPARELIVADAVTLRPQRRYKLKSEPGSLDVSQTGYAAVSPAATGPIELFQLASGQHAQCRPMDQTGEVRFRDDGKLLLATNLKDRSIVAFDVPSMQLIAELPLAMQPENLCFTPDHGQLFVTGRGMDGVAIVFPYRILEVEQTVLAGRNPGIMACSESPNYLFVGSADGSDVCVLSVDTRAVIGIVEVGGRPAYIAITPDNQYALVLEASAGDMAVIHIKGFRSDAEARRQKIEAALFTVLPVGNKPVHTAIVAKVG